MAPVLALIVLAGCSGSRLAPIRTAGAPPPAALQAQAAGQPIALQLSWTSDGALDALVVGGAGPGVETCVRSVVRRGRIAPTGRGGFVSHTIAP